MGARLKSLKIAGKVVVYAEILNRELQELARVTNLFENVPRFVSLNRCFCNVNPMGALSLLKMIKNIFIWNK